MDPEPDVARLRPSRRRSVSRRQTFPRLGARTPSGRFESEREYYPEDLDILGEQNPVLLGLETSPEDQRYPLEIDNAAVEKNAMVISPTQ